MKTMSEEVGWAVPVPHAGWLLHTRHGMSAKAPCGAELQGAFMTVVKAAVAHKMALCVKCFHERKY